MYALIPLALRALAHRRMALSALRANSSLSVHLNRYNSRMDRARSLENARGPNDCLENQALPPLQSIKFGARGDMNHLVQVIQGGGAGEGLALAADLALGVERLGARLEVAINDGDPRPRGPRQAELATAGVIEWRALSVRARGHQRQPVLSYAWST